MTEQPTEAKEMNYENLPENEYQEVTGYWVKDPGGMTVVLHRYGRTQVRYGREMLEQTIKNTQDPWNYPIRESREAQLLLLHEGLRLLDE